MNRHLIPFTASREALFNELHTRPFPVLATPSRLSHFAASNTGSSDDEIAHISELSHRYAITPPSPGSSCYYQDFGGFTLRWERHTEFSTYIIIQPNPADEPFSGTAMDLIPAEWIETLPGEIFSAQHLELQEAPAGSADKELLRRYFEGQRLIGSASMDAQAELWTSYRIHSDGFGRFVLLNRSLNPCQCGRLARALLELETYRMFMLESLPLAKSVSPQVREMDQELARIIQQITDIEGLDDERRLLGELSLLAARTEQLISDTNYRFSAAEAYHALVQTRIDELREREIAGLMTIREFLQRRLTPAWRTCEATRDHLEDLSERINRANELIRARVDLALESQNQALLQSMDRRSQLQLRLQQAVEGLSIAAISYYAVGLVKYVVTALKETDLPVNSDVVTGVSVPVIVAGVAFMVHRFKKKLHQ